MSELNEKEYAPAYDEAGKFISPVRRCPSGRYHEMLEILPPAVHHFDRFLVGEPSHGRRCAVTGDPGCDTFKAFFQIGADYYECERALTVNEFLRISTDEVLANVTDDPPKPA